MCASWPDKRDNLVYDELMIALLGDDRYEVEWSNCVQVGWIK